MISKSQVHLSRMARLCRVAHIRVCTLAFLAFLGAGAACAQHLEIDEAKGDGLSEWGPAKGKVRTRLVAHEKEFSVGKPILLRLEMENLGSRVIRYDAMQVSINCSMSIEGNDGVDVPCIAPSVETGGDTRVLNPGERTVLFERHDITDQYLITSSGSYKVRYRGSGEWFGEIAIPPSNVVTIRVADGPLRPSQQVARSLIDAAQPSGWQVAVSAEGSVVPLGRASARGASFVLHRRSATKASPLLLWVTATPSEIEPSGKDAQSGRTAERIGRCAWGDVYLWSGTATVEELSAARELIATALRIDDR